ncbi:MAG: hypothetical protein JF616_22310 [Fibrobacteres bacterium]|nr:hypothetical protein [Fibrobacterota bacterium]
MLDGFTRFAAYSATTLLLAACDPMSFMKKEDDETRQPATEATVIGIWRTNIPTGKTPPDPTDIKVTLDIEPDHTLLLSKRLATGLDAPNDYVEIVKEYQSWSVTDGKLVSTKTDCTYKDAATLLETSTDCSEPKTREADIDVKGSAWTLMEDGQPTVYRKD